VPLEIRLPGPAGLRSSLREAREAAEREQILRALEEAGGNVSAAARALGLERTNLHKRMRALGLGRPRLTAGARDCIEDRDGTSWQPHSPRRGCCW